MLNWYKYMDYPTLRIDYKNNKIITGKYLGDSIQEDALDYFLSWAESQRTNRTHKKLVYRFYYRFSHTSGGGSYEANNALKLVKAMKKFGVKSKYRACGLGRLTGGESELTIYVPTNPVFHKCPTCKMPIR